MLTSARFCSSASVSRYARSPNVKTFPNANRFQSPRSFFTILPPSSFFQPPRKLLSPLSQPSSAKRGSRSSPHFSGVERRQETKRAALAERLSFRVVAGNARTASYSLRIPRRTTWSAKKRWQRPFLCSLPLQNPIPPPVPNRETSAVDSPGRGGGALVNDRTIIASCSFAAKNHRLSSRLAARSR